MKWLRNLDSLVAVLTILPSVILLAIFVYGFIGQTIQTSLTNWGKDPAQALAINPVLQFVGLENYKELFSGFIHGRFRQDLVNNLFFTVFFVGGCLLVGLSLAIILDRGPKGEGFFRTVFLFPMSLSFIVTGTIWRWMLQPAGGVNQLPAAVGLPEGHFAWLTSRQQVLQFDWNHLPLFTAWLIGLILLWIGISALRNAQARRGWIAVGSAALLIGWAIFIGPRVQLLPFPEIHGFNLAFIGIIIAAIWQMSGYTMALYLAGLRGVPEELREAARVDGASEVQLYRHIIFPMLAPITLSAMIILGHISLKIFDLIWAMTGVDNAPTEVPALLMYVTTFRSNKIADGAAIATILLLLVALVIVPYLYSQLKSEVRR